VLRFFLSKDGVAAARLPFWPLIAPLLAFAGVISFRQTTSLDIWWHLKTGEWIWQQHRIPRIDPFSFTAAGKPWIAHEWLFGLVAFLIHRTSGLAGLIGAKALIVAAAVALAPWAARSRGATAGMTLLVLTASYAIARLRLAERSELISLLLAIAFLLVHEKSKDRRPLLLLLPALQLLWVNIHGGTALLGWFLAGGFLLDHARKLGRRGSSWLRILLRKELSWNVRTFVGVVAVSFVNPNTIQTLGYGLLRSESPLNNEEFQSLSRSFGRGLELAMAVFVVYAALMALLFVLRPRGVRIYEWLPLPSLVIVSVLFFRFRILFAFLLAPSLAWHLSQGKLLSRIRWWLPALVSLALLFQIANFERNSFTYRFGAGAHTGIFPVGAVEFVKRSGLSARRNPRPLSWGPPASTRGPQVVKRTCRQIMGWAILQNVFSFSKQTLSRRDIAEH